MLNGRRFPNLVILHKGRSELRRINVNKWNAFFLAACEHGECFRALIVFSLNKVAANMCQHVVWLCEEQEMLHYSAFYNDAVYCSPDYGWLKDA